MRKTITLFTLIALLMLAAACGGSEKDSGQATPPPGQAKPTVEASDAPLQELANSVSSNPSAEGYLNLGNAYSERARFNEAVEAYKKGLAINPNHSAILSNLGVSLYQMGRFNEAKDQFEKALKNNPDDAATTYLLGATYLQMGNQEKAETMFKKALAIDPTLPEAHFGLGTLYMLQGKKDLAIKEFETFLAGPPAQDPRARSEAERYLKQLKSGQ
jgi:tetratricopeptide (TPR) repeat protein